jgi:hypothetical protein
VPENHLEHDISVIRKKIVQLQDIGLVESGNKS